MEYLNTLMGLFLIIIPASSAVLLAVLLLIDTIRGEM